eukprot:gene5363-5598_t
MFSFLPPSEGPPHPQLCAFKQPVSQQVTSSITALLCQRAGITDPLAAGSRSNSPFIKPSQDANNATGVQTMHLPPAALPVVPAADNREVLITYFDPDEPAHGYCTYCPQRTSKPRLLQIRRSTYHEVVKAADVSRIADVSGIQHYVINGAKVLFLRPRPQPRPPKGVVAPARCAVDGRQLMDAHSSYCSLRCKLEVEDQIFADNYPSAHEEMEAAAAEQAGEGDGMAGGNLAGTYHRQGGHEGRRVVVPSSKRSITTPQAQAVDQEDGSSEEGDTEHKRAKRQRVLPSKYANALMGGTSTYAAAMASISKPTLQHGHRHSSHHQHKHAMSAAGGYLTIDDTANDQLVDALAEQQHAAAIGMLSMANMAGTAPALKHAPPATAAVQEAAASPCASLDSGRSTTCNQRWNHKRKIMQPLRAPLQ